MVRSDLPPGDRCAQLLHAAGYSARLASELPPDTHAVALLTDADGLARLEYQLQRDGIAHAAIREPDPPYLGELVAIGVAPQSRNATLRKLLSRFPLIE